MRGLFRWVAGALLVAALGASPAGCDNGYSQKTPDDVIKTARLMVERGDADRLTDLIYAENKQFRALLDQLGAVFGDMETLAQAVAKKYPDEVAKLKKDAEDAAARGEASSLFARLAGAGTRRVRGQGGGEAQDQFNKLVKALFADPYAFLRDNSGKLTTTSIDDDRAAVLWEGKPVFPPLGLLLQRQHGKWYMVLPTNLPGVSSVMPHNDDEYEIFGAIIESIDNMVVDLTDDVREGKARDLEEVSRKAGEKAFIPVALAAFAYSQAVEARKKEQRATESSPGPK